MDSFTIGKPSDVTERCGRFCQQKVDRAKPSILRRPAERAAVEFILTECLFDQVNGLAVEVQC